MSAISINIDDLCKKVRIVLDENEVQLPLTGGSTGTDATLMDNDALQTDDIIKTHILAAIDRVHMMAPIELVQDVITDHTATWSVYKLTQRAILPTDLLRLTYVKLGGWAQGVSNFVAEGTALYSTMFSRFMAVRPTNEHPMVGVCHGVGNSLEIVAAPLHEGNEQPHVRYIKKAVAGGNLAERCERAAVWMAANMYCTSIRENDLADRMAHEVAEELGLRPES